MQSGHKITVFLTLKFEIFCSMEQIKVLSELETYLITIAVRAGGVPDYRYLYIASHPKSYNVTPLTLDTYIRKWKNSKQVRDLVASIMAQMEKEKQEQEEKTKRAETGHNSSGDDKPLEMVNFQDRAEFVAYLEQQIKTTADEKTRLDYIKLLADAQQYKKPEQSETGPEYQRFYMPLRCQDCKLYQAKQEEITPAAGE